MEHRAATAAVAVVPETLSLDAWGLTPPVLVALLVVAFVTGALLARFFGSQPAPPPAPKPSSSPSSSSPSPKAEEESEDDDDEESDSDTEDEEESEDEDEDEDEDGEEHKMVLCVRTDLKMQRGKVAAQCGHAVLGAYRAARRLGRAGEADAEVCKEALRHWSRQGQAKIALAIPDEPTMMDLERKARARKLPTYIVADAGRTQIAAGSLTVLAIGPGTPFPHHRLLLFDFKEGLSSLFWSRAGPKSKLDEVTGHLKLF
jgi:PTH2 family peptidyl-tRNA hydrolase